MGIRVGFFAFLAVLVLGLGALSAGSASADRADPVPPFVLVDGGGGDPPGPDSFAAPNRDGTAQICETGPNSTTCVGKGWIAAGICKALGGDIIAGDPGGVFLCEFPNRD
jgi:hypothetical protein